MTLPTDFPIEPTPQQLAAMSADDRRQLLQSLLRQQAESEKRFGMSAGQQGLWYAFRREPQSTAFNVFLPSRVVSELDVDALHKAMDFLVDRHPCLRTTFSDSNAELVQTVHDTLPPEFTIVDASRFSEHELHREVLAQTQVPFDLQSGPMMRMVVFRRDKNDHVVVAVTHHIVVDFWSLILLLSELRVAYGSLASGNAPDLEPAAANYSSFVAEQQAILGGDAREPLWQHWQQTLQGASCVLDWFTDYQRPDCFTGRAGVVPLSLSPTVVSIIKRIAAEQSTTTNAVVLAALQVLIARYTREQDFLIGTPFSGRGHRKYEKTVGFFVNVLPLRCQLTDNPTFSTLVSRVGKTLSDAIQHESLPLAEIVRRLQPPRDASRSPLFQLTCTFEKSHLREEGGRASFLMPSDQASADIGGMKLESYHVPHPTCHHDIEIVFEPTENTLDGMICYCRDLFAESTVRQIASNFQQLFESLCQSPNIPVDEVSWTEEDAPARSAPVDGTPETLIEQLDEAFQRFRSEIALIDDAEVDYECLSKRSIHIAASLRARGIGRGDYVPVVGRPGPSTITAIVGVIRSGAAVVPIDSSRPAVNASELIEDTAARIILVDETTDWTRDVETRHRDTRIVAIEHCFDPTNISPDSTRDIDRDPVSPDDLAYVIYTSGSTGRPKGVMVPHGAIANTVRWRTQNVTLSGDDRVLMLLSHQFDAGFGIAISSLIQGASLVFPPRVETFDVGESINTVRRHRVTVLPAVPSLLQAFVSHVGFKTCDSIRQIWSGGESMPVDFPAQIRKVSSSRIWNFYGPTETAVEATAYQVIDVDQTRPIPIGTPINNTEVLVIDDDGRVVPDTVPGQIAIIGRGVAKGYLNQPELTRRHFVPAVKNSTTHGRMYLTGDLGRRRADGQLEILGRMDHQVKLHGYRIELEEIEHVIRTHPAVRDAAVKTIRRNKQSTQLAAFLVATDDLGRDRLSDIRRHVAEKLPAYKRPVTIDLVDRLPTGANGKIRREQLPDVLEATRTHVPPAEPSTRLEKYMADCWSDMLEIDRIGVDQNFFELGGSSLQAAILTARLTEDLGFHVPTSLLFDLADIASMSNRLAQLHPDEIETRFGAESVQSEPHKKGPGHRESSPEHSLIATLKPDGNQNPVVMVHPPGGIVICYRELAGVIDRDRPLLAIRSRGLHGGEPLPPSMEAMASDYVDAIRQVRPNGPYVVGGWSLGGVIAFEVARQLIEGGQTVRQLILLDSTIPDGASDLVRPDESHPVGLEYGIDMTLEQLSRLSEHDQLPFLWQHALKLGVLDESSPKQVVQQVLSDLKNLFHHHVKLTSSYRIRPLRVPTLLIRPADTPVKIIASEDRGWRQLVDDVEVRFVSGHHHSMVQQPHVGEVAKVIRDAL